MIHTIPILLALLANLMLIPAAFDLFAGNRDWIVFFLSSVLIFMFSSLGFFATRSTHHQIFRRCIFIFVPLIWMLFSLASAVPFMLAGLKLGFADAFFEAASGLWPAAGFSDTRLS